MRAATPLRTVSPFLQRTDSPATVSIRLAEPLWGAGFAYAALGEALSTRVAFGGAFVVLACLSSATPLGTQLSAALGFAEEEAEGAAEPAPAAPHVED